VCHNAQDGERKESAARPDHSPKEPAAADAAVAEAGEPSHPEVSTGLESCQGRPVSILILVWTLPGTAATAAETLVGLPHTQAKMNHADADAPMFTQTRAALLDGAGRAGPAQETAATADLDGRGLVQLQQSLMREQDQQVEQLEQTVNNTRVRLPFVI